VLPHVPDFRLRIVGDGPLGVAVQADVQQRGLGDQITFAGTQLPAQLPDGYRAADLCVLSSWSEGLPNVLRGAVACGRPFVTTDVGSVREMF
jgi:glycosyltransferase involved in cell wall biosynthesis